MDRLWSPLAFADARSIPKGFGETDQIFQIVQEKYIIYPIR